MQQIFIWSLSYFLVFSLAALAGMIAERSGVINLGIEGFMIFGGLSYAIYIFVIKSFVSAQTIMSLWIIWIIIGVVAAAIITALFSLLHSFIVLKLKTDQVISGTVINLLAQGLGLFMCNLQALGSQGNMLSTYLSPDTNGTNALVFYFIISIFITLVLGIYFTYTKTGTRHIAAGENPNALDAAGISVNKYRFWAICASAAVAGIAGVIFCIVITGQIYAGSVQGLGFISLAIMIMGQWRVSWITLFSLIFSVMFSVSKVIGIINIDEPLKAMLPFIMSLAVMLIASKWSSPPKASGQPFDKSLR